MCRLIMVRATTDNNKTPHPSMPEPVEFIVPNDFSDREYPICTCYIGDKEGEGKVLRHTFTETLLQPFLATVQWGNIIIEIR